MKVCINFHKAGSTSNTRAYEFDRKQTTRYKEMLSDKRFQPSYIISVIEWKNRLSSMAASVFEWTKLEPPLLETLDWLLQNYILQWCPANFSSRQKKARFHTADCDSFNP